MTVIPRPDRHSMQYANTVHEVPKRLMTTNGFLCTLTHSAAKPSSHICKKFNKSGLLSGKTSIKGEPANKLIL